jgi:hypothetical protein
VKIGGYFYGRTTMNQRTDIHRPSAINPADYDYVGSFIADPPYSYDGDLLCDPSELADYPQEHLDGASYYELLCDATSPDRAYPYTHSSKMVLGYREKCDHCGASLRYVAVYRHRPSGQFIATGHDCADNTMEWSDRRSLDLARQKKAMDAARKSNAEEEERRYNIERTNALFPEAVTLLMNYEGHNSFIQDVASRFTRWGTTKRITDGDYSAQEKVMAAVLKAHVRDEQRAEEKAKAADVPEGRITVEGEVLSVKEKVDYYGNFERLVMTVKADDGWVVWGTVPRALTEIKNPNAAEDAYYYERYRTVEKGERVEFTATIERSRKDRTFGFFKRPTKAKVL